jgi:alpha-N-acetylglucosaminidase
MALNDQASGRMKGIGLTMEGIEQNPVLYELMMQHTWTDKPAEPNEWLRSYLRNRYGVTSEKMAQAWQILKNTVYNGKVIRDGAESIVTGRPTFSASAKWTKTKLNYSPKDLLKAWDLFLDAIEECKNSEGFQYDLVDITRQVLANYAGPLQQKWVSAYRNKQTGDFNQYSEQFIKLMNDMDELLATRKDFLLGVWIEDAKAWGTNENEKILYERNARNLVTLWGDAESPLHEYSCRQWSGLLNDFYKVRWEKFFQQAKTSLVNGAEMDTVRFEKEIKAWEWEWVNDRKKFSATPSGDPVSKSKVIYEKYRNNIQAAMGGH